MTMSTKDDIFKMTEAKLEESVNDYVEDAKRHLYGFVEGKEDAIPYLLMADIYLRVLERRKK